MNKILLDSDVLIDFLHGLKKEPFASVSSERLYLSVISYAEVLYGQKRVIKSGKKSSEININQVLRDLYVNLVPFGQKECDLFVDLKLAMESKKEPLSDFDLMIASTAISLDLELLTNNRKHFGRISELKLAV